jgi:hypothetical protein
MTEDQWLACADPERMLRLLRFGTAGRFWGELARMLGRRGVGWARTRKLDLLGRACSDRTGWPWVEMNSGAIVAQLSPVSLVDTPGAMLSGALASCAHTAGVRAAYADRGGVPPHEDDHNRTVSFDEAAAAAERAAQCDLVRDIFGNPFRTVGLDPSWVTPTVVSLARQMYESRDLSAMPILADALQDAGCDSTDLLNHCRGGRIHVRGCWVVDLLLGKG